MGVAVAEAGDEQERSPSFPGPTPQSSPTISQPRPAFQRRAPSCYIPSSPATRGSKIGWGNEEGAPTASTYAAAARRNLTPSYHQSIDTSRTGRWNRSHSPRHHPSNPQSGALYVYTGDSQYLYENNESNRRVFPFRVASALASFVRHLLPRAFLPPGVYTPALLRGMGAGGSTVGGGSTGRGGRGEGAETHGLLCHPNTPFRAPAIQEVVDLLAETGVEDCDDWLSMLEDTEVNRTALDCVVRHITSDEEEMVTITDSTITSAKALLPLIPSKKVLIDLSRKESDVQGLIFEHHKYIGLYLHHQYKHPDQATLCDSLLRAMPRSHLGVFTGHLSGAGTQLLQEWRGLWRLHLTVCDQDAQEVLAAIRAVHQSVPQLHCLYLHVPVGAVKTQACTTRLPDCPLVNLVLSGVDERLLKEAAQIAQLLQPTQRRYRSIMFPGSSMKADVWQQCLDELATAGVRLQGVGGGIQAPDAIPIKEEEERELITLAKTRMLGGFTRWSEEDLWQHL
ncbi:hypothetical protein O3P69_004631 [Scylla paramamosain]|uniref:Uncharacterized protein n=1 Tax=Scylla paramamosain TaxID=85552 RepID=A0AAW0UCC6_SCYPA